MAGRTKDPNSQVMIATTGFIRPSETQYIPDEGPWILTYGPSPYDFIMVRDWVQIILDYWIWINAHNAYTAPSRMGRRCPGKGRCDKERDYG